MRFKKKVNHARQASQAPRLHGAWPRNGSNSPVNLCLCTKSQADRQGYFMIAPRRIAMPEETRQEQSEYSHHRRNFINGDVPPLLLADVPSFDRSSGPMLSAETIDEFIQWAAGVPAGEVEVIRERIANAREDENLIDQLTKELWRLPVRDVSRHGLLLSTIGELRDPRAASVLIKFIWYDGEIAPGDDRKRFLHSCSFEADGSEVLRARATEMLSYLSSSEAAEATLEIVARHPSDFVRGSH